MIFKTQLFDVPLYKTKASKHGLIRQHIDNHIIPEVNIVGVNDKERNIYSSYFPNAVKIPNALYYEFYKNDIELFLKKAGFNKLGDWEYTCKFWYNVGVENSYQEVHDHLSGPIVTTYSAIHYIKFDANIHLGTIFYHPLQSIIKTLQPTLREDLRPFDFLNLQKIIPVMESDLIFFPAYVPHSVPKQQSNTHRITIAFNICIKEKVK